MGKLKLCFAERQHGCRNVSNAEVALGLARKAIDSILLGHLLMLFTHSGLSIDIVLN